jgi:4-alpha-glucanotransferase
MVKEAAGDTAVVAEDLGVVPAYVPKSLEKLGIPGYKVPHFLREKDGCFVDGKTYPKLSLATPATHDHDPIAKMWRELSEKVEAGKHSHDPQVRHQAEEAHKEMNRWMKFCGADHDEPSRQFNEHIHETILRGVLNANSWLTVFMITDVFGSEARFNVPGSVAEGNWSYRLDKTVAELDQDPHLLYKTRMFTKLVKETHRLP